MSREELIEKEIRVLHKELMANYISKVIEVEFRVNGRCNNFKTIYNTCQDAIIYSKEELEELFQQVNDILQSKYNLILNKKGECEVKNGDSN